MDCTTLLVLAGYMVMPNLIAGPTTSSVGTSYCAPTCVSSPCGVVAAKTSPVYQTPCGPGFGHSTAYNYGVYPVRPSAGRNIAAAAAAYGGGRTLEK